MRKPDTDAGDLQFRRIDELTADTLLTYGVCGRNGGRVRVRARD